MNLPLELWLIIFNYCDNDDKYLLSQTCSFLKKLKCSKPAKYYCNFRSCNGYYMGGNYLEYIFKYFYNLEECLKYSNDLNEYGHYVEFGKIIYNNKTSKYERKYLYNVLYLDSVEIDGCRCGHHGFNKVIGVKNYINLQTKKYYYDSD